MKRAYELEDAMWGDVEKYESATGKKFEGSSFSNVVTDLIDDVLSGGPNHCLWNVIGSRSLPLTLLTRMACLAHKFIHDEEGGVDGEGHEGVRRMWYNFYKIKVAIPVSNILGEDIQDEKWSKRWFGRLSEAYGHMIDNYGVTYYDMWIVDMSRMMDIALEEDRLFSDMMTVCAVEKDSLFHGFNIAAKAAGVAATISGKGKASKAATELMLRRVHENSTEITEDEEMLYVTVSDYDYDGHTVIAPTFANQAERYQRAETRHVGVYPHMVKDWNDKAYQVKDSNKATREWGDEYGIRGLECTSCGKQVLGIGINSKCKDCGAPRQPIKNYPTLGFEVESVPSRSYFAPMAKAIIEEVGWDIIIDKLRTETKADPEDAALSIASNIAFDNPHYRALHEERKKLTERMQRLSNAIIEDAERWVEWENDDHRWYDVGAEPDESDYVNHVARATYGTGVWRPFAVEERTEEAVKDYLSDKDHAEQIKAWKEMEL